MKLRQWKWLFMLLPSLCLVAQDFPATPLSSTDWVSNGTEWSEVSQITVHPFADMLEVSKGAGILYTSKPSILSSKKSFGNYKLLFEFVQDSGNQAMFHLGNGLKIDLSDSNTFGTLVNKEGQKVNPSQSVHKLPGLWQKVALTYSLQENTGLAVLEELIINEVTLVTNYVFQNPPSGTNPIRFENKKGLLGIKNAEFIELAYEKPVSISNLTYTLQETGAWQTNWMPTEKEAIQGTAESMTLDVPNDYRWFSITYKGDINVGKTDKYALTLEYTGVGYLKIDGKEVVGSKNTLNRQPVSDLVELTKGKHTFEYFYRRVWQKPAFGLFISAAGFRSYSLHPHKNLPLPEYPGVIHQNPTGPKAKIIRSFMSFGEEKRTTVISVGTAQKKNYSFDLAKGTMLYAWQGDFADVTEMWHNRGEPQLLKPLGQVIKLSGKPSFSQGADDTYVFEEYFLDKKGLPTFLHSLNGMAVSQKMEPAENGLIFTIGAENNDISYLLGEGNHIEKMDDRLFKVDDHYVWLSQSAPVEIRKEGEKMTLSGKANAIESYQLIW